MLEPGQKVYRAYIHYNVSQQNGLSTFTTYGVVTPCGQWVEQNSTRHQLSQDWHATAEAAKASLAPEMLKIGAKIIEQAAEFLSAERCKEVPA